MRESAAGRFAETGSGRMILKPEAPPAPSTRDSLGGTRAKARASAVLWVHGELRGNMNSEDKSNEGWEVCTCCKRKTMGRTVDTPDSNVPNN